MRLKMKLRNIIAVAVLLAPVPFVGMTVPAEAAVDHIIVLDGWVQAEDGPSLPDPTYHDQKTPFHHQIVLTHEMTKSHASFVVSTCADDEVKATLSVGLNLLNDESVVVSPRLLLFHGSDCTTQPLDNVSPLAAHAIEGGRGGGNWQIFVPSRDYLGTNLADANLTVTHSLWP
ncbi:hypothetical protein ABT247_31930 [Kitasatospora sp. NPDC001539]|uniref:hypothetical protein n=1 Tax=Kitasatospora sp. NPDC001539 TaxID=3154384 RepID=UPI003325F34C